MSGKREAAATAGGTPEEEEAAETLSVRELERELETVKAEMGKHIAAEDLVATGRSFQRQNELDQQLKEARERENPRKRRRAQFEMAFTATSGKMVEKFGSVLLGRTSAKKRLERAIALNYERRTSTDHAAHTFLIASGHVRSGKTRMGHEVPRILQEMSSRRRSPLPNCSEPFYVFIKLSNGSRFNPAVDLHVRPSVALGARIAASVSGGEFHSFTGPDQVEHLDAAAVLARIVHQQLDGGDEGAVLPIVLHFDEHQSFTEAVAKYSSQRTEAFKELARVVGSCMMADVGPLSGLRARGRYFIVPVMSGTSFQNAVPFEMSRFPNRRLPLPLLGWPDSRKMAASLLTKKEGLHKSLLHDEYFGVALADTGGFPGFIAFLVDATSADARAVVSAKSYQDELDSAVSDYVSTNESIRPPGAAWEHLVSLAVAQTPVLLNTVIGGAGGKKLAYYADSGFVYTTVPARGGGVVEVSIAPSLLRLWHTEAGQHLFQHLTLYKTNKLDPWTWQRFEIFHLNFLAARIRALLYLNGDCDGDDRRKATRLVDVLCGAMPRSNKLLKEKVEIPAGVSVEPVETDEGQCLPTAEQAGTRQHSVEHADYGRVHQACAGTPIVDGYVTLRRAGRGEQKPDLCVFLQYKHSGLEVGGAVNVAKMNKAVATLRETLQKSGWPGKEVAFVLVYVTNRKVTGYARDADPALLWMSRDEMRANLGVFAGRGLVSHLDDSRS